MGAPSLLEIFVGMKAAVRAAEALTEPGGCDRGNRRSPYRASEKKHYRKPSFACSGRDTVAAEPWSVTFGPLGHSAEKCVRAEIDKEAFADTSSGRRHKRLSPHRGRALALAPRMVRSWPVFRASKYARARHSALGPANTAT